jgi:hypothetical protein
MHEFLRAGSTYWMKKRCSAQSHQAVVRAQMGIAQTKKRLADAWDASPPEGETIGFSAEAAFSRQAEVAWPALASLVAA